MSLEALFYTALAVKVSPLLFLTSWRLDDFCDLEVMEHQSHNNFFMNGRYEHRLVVP